MADFLSIEVLGERNLLRNLEYMPDTVRVILVAKTRQIVEAVAQSVEDNIRRRLNKTDKIKAFSGSSKHLADSVEFEVNEETNRVEGRVYISGIPYARIQEDGGVTPAHIIRPKNAKILAFMGYTGEKVFATRVMHPGGQIAGVHYMKDARREHAVTIARDVKNAVVQGIRQNMRASSGY
jgi:hypothetical protein